MLSFLRLIVIGVLFYLIYRLLWGLVRSEKQDRRRFTPPPRPVDGREAVDLVKDPETGVYFPKSEGIASDVDGKVLYFLNRENRDRYLEKRRSRSRGGA